MDNAETLKIGGKEEKLDQTILKNNVLIQNSELRSSIYEMDRLRKELERRKRERGMDFYIPNPIQDAAHRSNARTILFIAGNRSGKTTFAVMELCWALTKKYPDWFPVSRRFNRPIKARISVDRVFKIESVIEPAIRKYLPINEMAATKRGPQRYLQTFRSRDGSYVEFLSGEQDTMASEGQDLDFFWADEPLKRSHYIASQRGLIDRNGLTLLTFTPLCEPWMKEEIVDKADGKTIEVFFADTRDNKFDVKGNVILREENIQRFERELNDDEKETRIHGKFFHLRGLVYKEFNPAVHCIEKFEYEQGYPVVCVLDPHDRQPHHVIWAMIDRINDIYVMYEVVEEGTVAQISAKIKAVEKFFGWNVVRRIIDPNFGRKPLLSSGLTVISEFYKYRLNFTEADDNVDAGRMKVKEYLRYDRNRPLDINNKPKLFFVRHKCPKTIHSIQNLQYDEWRGASSDLKDPKEETREKDSHGADVVRYLCIGEPKFYSAPIYEPQLKGAYY
jgi:hypothetical protein